MAYSRYGRTWGTKETTSRVQVPLKPPIDPEHLDPTLDSQTYQQSNPLWVESSPTYTLPHDLTGEPFGTPVGGGGPVEHVNRNPSVGIGVGPGLTMLESQDLRAIHGVDDGSIGARQWQTQTDRDGKWNLVRIEDTPGDGVSSNQPWLRYARGVGVAHDPNARTAGRWKRWVDRVIDFHRYEVEYRPHRARYAVTASMDSAGHNPTQYTPQFLPAQMHNPGSNDRFVVGQNRVEPTSWQANDSGDYMIPNPDLDPGHGYGLPSWGL